MPANKNIVWTNEKDVEIAKWAIVGAVIITGFCIIGWCYTAGMG